jgi:uncharacterized repeat protein (TIGR04052 family)
MNSNLLLISSLVLSACAPESFSLQFAALVDGAPVGCNETATSFGTPATNRIGVNDLRFYISNLQLLDRNGRAVATSFDKNDFQFDSPEGRVALVDLTGNTEGSCAASMLGGGEGTARTHTAITGQTLLSEVSQISFDVGVPQAVMKKVIADNTAEGAPSPLAEMHWSWNGGYRHLVFNFTVKNEANVDGEGYLHVGSRNCSTMGMKALADRDSCEFVNNPKVSLSDFDLKKDTVGIDLRQLLSGLDFVSPVYDMNFMPIGTGPGVECHSSPMQTDCPIAFGQLGVDIATGQATAAGNKVFVRKP